MKNFEMTPSDPRVTREYQIDAIILEAGFQATVLENTNERIRISVTTQGSVGTGKETHEAMLAHLMHSLDFVTADNARVVQHPQGSYNIEIQLLDQD